MDHFLTAAEGLLRAGILQQTEPTTAWLLRLGLRAILETMGVRATVRNGRLTVDQPVDLPEGTVLDLVIDDEGDQFDDREREALAAAISRSLKESEEARSAPAGDIIQKLRERRHG